MKLFRVLVLGLCTFLFTSQSLWAQKFDFPQYPRLDFSFEELQLDLDIRPKEGSIEGTANYSAIANIDGVDSLVLQAAHMEIRSVAINGEEADFGLRNDSLIVQLGEPYQAGQSLEVSVGYITIPRFGVLQNDRSTMWSSLLPLSHRHWFPTIDHPRVTFNFGISLTVPSGYRAVSNGVRLDEEVLDLDRVRFDYRTRSQIPASSAAFAIGRFEQEETSFGIKRITINSEEGILAREESRGLLNTAYETLQKVEQRLGMEFPYERLHIVVLSDHFWETKSWGASTVFLYKNGGDLAAQLRRAIFAQWFGVYQREEQWTDADAITLLQATLENELVDSVKTVSRLNHPSPRDAGIYETFSAEKWNSYTQNFEILQAAFRKTVSENLSELLSEGEGVYGFRDYGEFWYEKNGQPVFGLDFDTRNPEPSSETGRSDSVIYRVDFEELGNNLRLTFQALEGGYEELVTLPLVQITPERIDTLEVTFTGVRDSVSIQVPPVIQNVKILASERPNLKLYEYKPAPYLIYQLRNGTTVEERAEAARILGHHSDNPDLQLAIRDFMSADLDPRIRAPLISSFGDITAGASGTEEVFLNALQSENREIQRAGLFVLQNYPDNEQVQQAVRRYAVETDSLPVFRDASRVYFSIADSAALNSFVSEVVKADTAGHRAIFAIQELANAGNVDRALRQAEFYISDVYEYPVRAKALQILLQHDRSPESWEGRVPELLDDTDPRIRYLTLRGMSDIEGIDYGEMLGVIIQDEYDQRVYQLMESMLNLGG